MMGKEGREHMFFSRFGWHANEISDRHDLSKGEW